MIVFKSLGKIIFLSLISLLLSCSGGSEDTTAPVFKSNNRVSVNENQVAVTTVKAIDQSAVTYSIVNKADANYFAINSGSGKLRFKTAPDYENPADADANNIYKVTVRATDTAGNKAEQQISVTVLDVDDIAPVFKSNNKVSVNENQVAVTTVKATDQSAVTYSIVNKADANHFAINSGSGKLRFKTAPDYENPADADTNNIYKVTVRAVDTAGNKAEQQISVTVLDVDDIAPVFKSNNKVSVNENQVAVTTVKATDQSAVTYGIVNKADANHFAINSGSGKLRFKSAPDYENPADADANNIYKVTVRAIDTAGNKAEQQISVTIHNIDENPPVITSSDTVSVNENKVAVTTVKATDQSAVTYSIVNKADANHFAINSGSGELRFKTAPDYENPADADANNIYKVTVRATDTAGNKAEQQISVKVLDVLETARDSDGDFIPDDVETHIGSDPDNSDENENGILDGLDTAGIRGDTFFDRLWHIRSLGTHTNDSGAATIEGNDLDVIDVYRDYMGYNGGNNIIVSVVDTGVDADHEDLVDNMDMARSYNDESVGDPSSTTGDAHGTMVAGIIAARAFNGVGVRGIVPFAKIAGSNWLENQTVSVLEKVWLTGNGANEIAVTNNSWGSYFETDTIFETIMHKGVNTLRDGKGRVYVFPATYYRKRQGNANYAYKLSNRYPVVVASLKHDNTHADYSNPGSNIWVSAYSGNYHQDSPTIGTTYIAGQSSNAGDINTKNTWSDDTLKNYTYEMRGTSAAAPMVSSAIALMLEACPDLTWRDVKYLVAKHATPIDTSNSSWVKNAAGYKHSVDYGFGLVNTKGMIDKCKDSYNKLPAEITRQASATFNSLIPDNGSKNAFTVNIPHNVKVEWVEVTIDNDNPHAGDYEVILASPSGTKTQLLSPNTSPDADGSWADGGFRLATAAMLGENSNGDWKIIISDELSGDSGTLKTIKLKVYGH